MTERFILFMIESGLYLIDSLLTHSRKGLPSTSKTKQDKSRFKNVPNQNGLRTCPPQPQSPPVLLASPCRSYQLVRRWSSMRRYSDCHSAFSAVFHNIHSKDKDSTFLGLDSWDYTNILHESPWQVPLTWGSRRCRKLSQLFCSLRFFWRTSIQICHNYF